MVLSEGGPGGYISVIGASEASVREAELAYQVGEEIARAGFVLVCGGLGGVMEAAARGAAAAEGLSVGILPGDDRTEASRYLSVSIPTGFSHGRNYLVVKAADGVIAVGGGAGTMSEIGLALKLGRPVILLESFELAGLDLVAQAALVASGPIEAVRLVKTRLASAHP